MVWFLLRSLRSERSLGALSKKHTDVKPCDRCGRFFARKPKYSQSQWDAQRWCGRSCGAWNKGLTKDDDPRMMQIAESVAVTAKGRPAWNAGRTKHDDKRLALISVKVSQAQLGKTVNNAQMRGLEQGRMWCAGKTAETDPRLAARGDKVRKALSGRVRDDHSARMRAYYQQNPDKHPNAIVAQKTRGHGYTYIEILVAEYLAEMGLEYEFNRRIGRKWVDFAIDEFALVVEADGEYWHRDKEREARRDQYLRERGWAVVHLTGSQIVNDADGCKAVVRGTLREEEAS